MCKIDIDLQTNKKIANLRGEEILKISLHFEHSREREIEERDYYLQAKKNAISFCVYFNEHVILRRLLAFLKIINCG